MSKNSKKQTRRTSSVPSPVNASPATGRSAEREFSPDYSYVVKDLKRIGILAGTFFVVLVVLSFILK